MTLPNFFILGAAKSGTTSLYHYLKGHPQIYMSPVKEPEFFSFMGQRIDRGDHRLAPGIFAVTDPAAYEALFKDAGGKPVVGEASPSYLYVPEAAQKIRTWIPDPKFVAILRDPAERAYSHFNMRRNKGSANSHETLDSFEEALKAEEARIREGWACGWHYKARGFYYGQVKRYHDLFGRERLRVFLYEDLCSDPRRVLKEISRFLGVDDSFMPDLKRVHNKGRYQTRPRSRLLQGFLMRENPFKSLFRPLLGPEGRRWMRRSLHRMNTAVGSERPAGLDPRTRKHLVEEYREDILKLQGLIGRDLSAWLEA